MPRRSPDIERTVIERQTMRALIIVVEGFDQLGGAVAVSVPQYRDMAGIGSVTSSDLPKARLGQKDIAIGSHRQPASIPQTFREQIPLKSVRQLQ